MHHMHFLITVKFSINTLLCNIYKLQTYICNWYLKSIFLFTLEGNDIAIYINS